MWIVMYICQIWLWILGKYSQLWLFRGFFHLQDNRFTACITPSQAGPQLVLSVIARQMSFPTRLLIKFLATVFWVRKSTKKPVCIKLFREPGLFHFFSTTENMYFIQDFRLSFFSSKKLLWFFTDLKRKRSIHLLFTLVGLSIPIVTNGIHFWWENYLHFKRSSSLMELMCVTGFSASCRENSCWQL